MCGIVGIWDFENKIEPALLETMRDTLRHRGPDDCGTFIDESVNVGLGHQRLTVLDLTPSGRQPMEFDGLQIVHNGEIYNFKEIRKTLEARGYDFKSQSDTEVILKSYREWGLEAVDRFRGMFAFCLWDRAECRLTLVRDRAGVKPLYYYYDGNLFIFASELKAIIRHPAVKKEIDFDALALFFKFGYIPAPHSIIRNVSKLEAGCILTLDTTQKVQKSRYWDALDYFGHPPDLSEESISPDFRGECAASSISESEAAETLEAILLDSFQLRLVSDVPVGIFLSGGIDSSLVTALLQKEASTPVKTFTIGFEDEVYNEAENAKKIAEYLGTDHHELYCTSKMAMEIIPKIAEIYDEPFGDSSAIPTYLVSRFARSSVKVALSADGGDEIFSGYTHHARLNRWYQTLSRHRSAGRLAARGFLWPPAKRLLESIIPNFDFRAKKLDELARLGNSMAHFHFCGVRQWSDDEITTLLNRSTKVFDDFLRPFEAAEKTFPDFFSFMRAADYTRFLPGDIPTKVDRATMAVSLEGRDPLLDHRIIEYASRLPSRIVSKDGISKYPLKKILYKYVPKDLVDRPKQGFTLPLDKWLKEDLKHLICDYLNEARIKRDGLLEWKTVECEINNFFSGRMTGASRLWFLFEFELWREKWLGRSG